MRALGEMTWVELKLFLREPITVVFVLVLPLVTLYVLNGVFGTETSPQVWEGLSPVDFYTSAYVALVVATVGVLSLPVHLSGYREKGVLRRFRASALPPPVLVTAPRARQHRLQLLDAASGHARVIGRGAHDGDADRSIAAGGSGQINQNLCGLAGKGAASEQHQRPAALRAGSIGARWRHRFGWRGGQAGDAADARRRQAEPPERAGSDPATACGQGEQHVRGTHRMSTTVRLAAGGLDRQPSRDIDPQGTAVIDLRRGPVLTGPHALLTLGPPAGVDAEDKVEVVAPPPR